MAKSEVKEPDYEFKTKRQIVAELEHAPEPELQDETDNAEESARLKQEAKEKEKKAKQLEIRMKRMQAFQAKSDLREPETEDDFYKSFNEAEEEQRLKKEEFEQAPTETGEFLK